MTEAPPTLSVERMSRTEWITLQRTDQMNAMSMQMLHEMTTALENAMSDDAVRAIVLTGSGRAFCAGADLKEVAGSNHEPGQPDLLDLVGRARGLKLMSTGEMLDAATALEIGLYDAVGAENEDIDDTIEAFLEPIRKQKPQSMRAFKAVSDSHRRGDSRTAMQETETNMFVRTWVHDDHWEAAEKVLPSKG